MALQPPSAAAPVPRPAARLATCTASPCAAACTSPASSCPSASASMLRKAARMRRSLLCTGAGQEGSKCVRGGGGGGGETGGRCACRRSPPRMLTAASCLRACSMGPPGWRHAAPGRLAQALHHHLHIPPKFLEIDCPAGILVVLPLPLSHVGRPRRQAQPPKRRLRGAGVEWRRPAPDVGGRTGGVSAWTERQLDGFQGSSGAAPRAKATVRAAQSAPPLPPAPEGRSRRHLTDRRAG